MSKWRRSPALPSTITLLLCTLFLVTIFPLTIAKPYKYLSYAEIHRTLVNLVDKYPKLIRLYSAQQAFLLPHVGNCTEYKSPTDSTPSPIPCTIWVVELSNLATLHADPTRPEMLVSGLLHGDEVVGPHVVLAFLEHMLENYDKDTYIQRMVNTRVLTLIPMTNAIGFFRNERTEQQIGTNGTLNIDPNRDFGFSQQPEMCMQTVCARVINELFKMHLFRVLLTFHGGTNALGYEWGDSTHCKGAVCKPAPDAAILHALAARMADHAGSAGKFESKYPIGDMGKLVYSVSGGLEDWAYGASWSGQGVVCTPKTLGGYPKERTKLETVQKRCATYLIETGKEKTPPEHELGDSDDLNKKMAAGDGHVPRNFRLILAAMESLDPYVILHSSVSLNADKMPVLGWTVGGAFEVDGAALQWSSISGDKTGLGESLSGPAGMKEIGVKDGSFSGSFTRKVPTSDPLYVRVVAVVDQKFAVQPNNSVPNMSPQSHLMGSRASSKWDFSVKGRQVRGRTVFFSRTRKLSISESGKLELSEGLDLDWSSRSQSDTELFDLLAHGGGDIIQPYGVVAGGGGRPLTVMTEVLGVLIILSIGVAIYVFVRRKRVRRADRAKSTFSQMDTEDDEERKSLAPGQEDFGLEDEEILSVPAARSQPGSHYMHIPK